MGHFMQTTSRGYRINPNWQTIEPGEAIVSDYRKTEDGKLIPFICEPLKHEPDRTKCGLGGSLALDICWPYGALEGDYV